MSVDIEDKKLFEFLNKYNEFTENKLDLFNLMKTLNDMINIKISCNIFMTDKPLINITNKKNVNYCDIQTLFFETIRQNFSPNGEMLPSNIKISFSVNNIIVLSQKMVHLAMIHYDKYNLDVIDVIKNLPQSTENLLYVSLIFSHENLSKIAEMTENTVNPLELLYLTISILGYNSYIWDKYDKYKYWIIKKSEFEPLTARSEDGSYHILSINDFQKIN